MAAVWPSLEATCSGVAFESVCASSDAPASISARMASRLHQWPYCTAKCSGVHLPASARASSAAPASTSAVMTAVWP